MLWKLRWHLRNSLWKTLHIKNGEIERARVNENRRKTHGCIWKAEDLQQRDSLKVKAWVHTKWLYDMIDTLEKLESWIRWLCDDVQTQVTLSQPIHRQINACIVLMADLLRMEPHLSKDWEESEKIKLHILLDNEYAQSIDRDTTFRTTSHSHHYSHLSDVASISAKRIVAAAEIAAKMAEVELPLISI